MSYRIDGYARVRQAIELSDKLLPALADVNGDPARFPRGAKVRFEFGLFYNDTLADASQIILPRLRIFDTSDPDSVLALDSNSGTVRVKGSLTSAQWLAGDPADAHIVVEFSASQTAEGVFTTAPADGDVEHWFLLTYGAGGDFLAAGKVKSFDAGYTASGTPPAGGTTATVEAIQALIDAQLAGVVRFKGNAAGHEIELTSANGKLVRYGVDDNGNPSFATQPVD